MAGLGQFIRQFAVLMGVFFATAVTGSAMADSGPLLTTIAQLHHVAEPDHSLPVTLRLAGTVLWASPDREQFIMQDASGGIRVQMDLRSQPRLQIGQKIRLEGGGLIRPDGLNEFLINNDGIHAVVDKSETIYLTQGRHPIRLDWFNATGLFELEVSYQGPGIPRQPIPDPALFRPEEAGNGITNWVNGLDYQAYEGSWEKLPDFRSLPIRRTGIASNFVLSVRSQDLNAGLRFNGLIEIPTTGLYTFWSRSDDGSRLFIGEFPLRLTVEDGGQLPAPQKIFPDQPLSQNQDCLWSTIEGTVTFVAEHVGSMDLDLNSGTGLMHLHVAEAAGGYSRLLLNSKIRVQGIVQSTFTTGGQSIGGTLLIPAMQQIEMLEPAPGLWNSCPLRSIGSLLHTNSFNPAGDVIHVSGAVRSVTPGKSIRVEDASGQVEIVTSQSPAVAVGSQVEAVGYVETREANVVLNCGFYRSIGKAAPKENVLPPVLTKVAQVKSLTQEAAQKGYPVKVRGIITAPFASGFFIQDGTWAIYVRWEGLVLTDSPRTGDFWEVEGTTYAEFSPNIQATHAIRLGPGIMPEPLRPTPDQFANGSLDTRYVEIQGVVTDIGNSRLQMLTPEGPIQVQLSDIDPAFGNHDGPDLKQYENALIRIRGCAIPGRDYKTQQLQLGSFWVWLCNYAITVDQPAPVDPFSVPLKAFTDLRSFNPHASILERVKVAGQILHQQGSELFLWDGTNGLRFILKQPTNVPPGDLVQVVGFPDLSGSSLVLREAVLHRTGHAPLPRPRLLPGEFLADQNYDGSLVRIEARLTDISTVASDKILTLQMGAHGFVARLSGNQPLPRDLLSGSRVELSGIYVSQIGVASTLSNTAPFELLLNAPDNITVLEHPSWWTLQRLVAACGVIILVLAGAILWIFTLKRRVRAQALLIHHKVEREATLEERARIARDIHDTLEQALAGTSLQLNALADSMQGVSPEPQRILKVARSMINHAQGEARRTVRNLRLLDLEKHSLPAALSQFATQSGNDSRVKIIVSVNGTYQTLPNQVENHLLRIGQEAVTNAIKHAGAKNIRVELNCEAGSLCLSVHDDGCGFNTNQTVGVTSGHFGLLGMRERAEKIGGKLQVTSTPGAGTTISVTLATTGPVLESDNL